MAGTTRESFPVGMAGCAVLINKMAMITTIIISVVTGAGVAGLADSIPGLTIVIESEVVRHLLENRKVKGAVNVPCFFPNKLKISCLYIRVGICGRFRTVGIVTGPAINDSVSAINHVIAHIAHF